MGSLGDEVAAAQWEGGGGNNSEKIVVSVRLRPLSEKEVTRGEPSEWECINESTVIFRNSLHDRPMAPSAYSFDRVFHGECTTRQVYEEAAKEVALKVLSGVNSSIFAYGQTSSGKTYTMTGITEYTVADIYEYIRKHEERAFVLKFSAIEIYNEVVRDLLSTESTNPLRILDDSDKGTIVEKLTEEVLRDRKHLKELISICEAQRKTGETYLNEFSSRSHQILRLTIESSAREFLSKDTSSTLTASVNFVDLAGSERASQAMSAGTRLKEGCHINRSLLTLSTVIRKLSKGRSSHVPYRESKLTRILQPCLGGNARTAIICTLSSARAHAEQSRNTLLFASYAKEVATNAQVNVVVSDKALVKELRREVERLEGELRVDWEGVVRERDVRIGKMEREIRELKMQRDLAQSRLEDLLKAVGEDPLASKLETSGLTGNSFAPPHSHHDFRSTADSSINQNSSYTRSTIHHSSSSPLNDSPTFGLVNRTRSSADSDETCKEVQCVDEPGQTGQPDSPASSITLEQHLENVRRNPNSNNNNGQHGFRGFELSRSQSCRYSSNNNNNNNSDEFTPPSLSLTRFQGRGKNVISDGTETEALSRDESMLSESAITSKTGAEGEFTGIGEFVAELKEMAQNVKEEPASPSRWPFEFERKQQEIIQLWSDCHVSLLHRTYFFLLFKGDVADSIYLEVELRRLGFVKTSCLDGKNGMTIAKSSLGLSEKKLRRERDMLSKQMLKRLTSVERESIYTKWGISLTSKRRRVQLSRLLWNETEDLEHVRESASLVAKLIGLLEPGQALREMFGLSFTPQERFSFRKGYNSWRYGSSGNNSLMF